MNDCKTSLSSKEPDNGKENFVIIYNKMFKELTGRDIKIIANNANGQLVDDKRIKLSFFERELIADLGKEKIYYIKNKKADEGEYIDTYSSSLILHYLLNADGTPLAVSWISYRELPGGLFYWQTIPKVLEPLVKEYESNGEGFLKKTIEIGGKKYDQFKFAAIVHPFKMFPVLIVLDEKSTEFEANIRVLFDGSAPHYLKTDVVKLIVIYIVKKLCSK